MKPHFIPLGVLALLLSMPVTAERGNNKEQGPVTEVERAASMARQRSGGGQVLRVSPDKSSPENPAGYRAKVLTPDGKVRTLRIDPSKQ